MKLFIIVAVSVIVCSNALEDVPVIVQLLEGIVNETKLQYQRDLAQENVINDLIARVESLETRCTASVCGSTGWTRIAYLNMSDPSEQCPTELRLYDEGGVRACGRQLMDKPFHGSCDSVTFSTNCISYSQVCGRVIGYQYNSPEAFLRNTLPIDSYYVDGISITHGSPRQHIWTLACGFTETIQYAQSYQHTCPCGTGETRAPPSFVGDDYFCESGNPSGSWSFHSDDPLWDGEGCGGDEGPCCNLPMVPWFHKVLDSHTTDDIELRVCADETTGNEDTPVGLYEIYIK